MSIKKFEDFFINEDNKTIKVKEVEPYGGMYSDENGDKYYQDDKKNIYKQVDGVWHICTDSGEAEYPVRYTIEIDEATNEAKINEVGPMKFTKSTAGMIPANKKQEFKTDVKLKKSEWDAMFDKINKLTSAKRAEIIKKLHQMGLM